MLALARLLLRALELVLALPLRLLRLVFAATARPNLGPFRHGRGGRRYLLFALLLVYVVAPLRGIVGQYFLADKLRYDAERWLATAVYDAGGGFVGTFDPRLDSQRDVNYTDAAIALGGYIANPDHKSIPVREVPEHYWQLPRLSRGPPHRRRCSTPTASTSSASSRSRSRPSSARSRSGGRASGVGGSTLPMQFVRVIYNTPPGPHEGGRTKLKRKFKEWWLAPVIYRELTRGGDDTPLKQWAANHIWLAQRTGGAPLHGVEITSRVVFGKEAKDLSIAEQFVLASAVNKPIILLPGSERLNEVRLDRWRYITEVRARICAEKLIADEAEQKPRDLRARQPGGRTARPARQAEAAGGARGACAGACPARARQSRHPRQRADAGGALRHARGDEAGLRLRLARARARRHDHARRGGEPFVPRAHQGAARQDRPAAQGQDRRRLHARSGQGAASRRRPQDARRDRRRGQRAGARSCATSRRARRPPTSARRSRAAPPPATTTRPAKGA